MQSTCHRYSTNSNGTNIRTKERPESLTDCFFLHRNHRCKDTWFQGFLKQARDGALEWDMYNFIHGYSTFCPGSWLPPRNASDERRGYLECQKSKCMQLWETEWPACFARGMSWSDMQVMECTYCQEERQRRNRLLQPTKTIHLEPPFAMAPYIHPYNAPKCHVGQLRAILAAQTTQQKLLWCCAVDVPSTRDDETRSAEALRTARRRW